jgi:anti-sigma regulatory factor (Ser/Thr protein kinase)
LPRRWPPSLERRRQEPGIDANPTRLRFPGTLPGFEQGFAALRSALDGCGLDDELRFRVELVFEEIVANIVRHAARPAGETQVAVTLEAARDVITLTFDDDGAAFDPCSHALAGRAATPSPASLETAPDGGFGLMMVSRAASKMSYRRTPDARNHLTVELQAVSSVGH